MYLIFKGHLFSSCFFFCATEDPSNYLKNQVVSLCMVGEMMHLLQFQPTKKVLGALKVCHKGENRIFHFSSQHFQQLARFGQAANDNFKCKLTSVRD
jgi:hypothetical protein